MSNAVDDPLPSIGGSLEEDLPQVNGGEDGPLATPTVQSYLTPPAPPIAPAPLFQGPAEVQDTRSLPLTSRPRVDYDLNRAFQR